MTAAIDEMESIPLSGIPSARYVIVVPLILLLGVETILLFGHIAGLASLSQALMWIPFGLFILGAWMLGMFLGGKGTVNVSARGIQINAANGTREVSWRHVAEIIQMDDGVITLGLSRPLRVGVLKFGTDVVGIPTWVRTVQFRVSDGRLFKELASRYREV